MSLASNVLSRFLEAKKSPLQGFIPDAWFKGKKAELRAHLAFAVSSPEDARFEIDDRIIPFFLKFSRDFVDLGVHPQAVTSIQDRVSTVVHVLERISEGHGALARLLSSFRKEHDEPGYSQVTSHIASEIERLWEKKFKTLGGTLEEFWRADGSAIQTFSDAALRKATPQEVDALSRLSKDDFGTDVIHTAYAFYQRVVDGKIKSFLSKEKIDNWDFTKWVDRIQAMMAANYTDDAIQKGDLFQEFNLYGMKIVVDDRTVDESLLKKYIRFLDETYARFKAKRMSSAWYGTVFIQCESCGGVNPLGVDLGVGGDYHITKDTIRIYDRPSPGMVELLAHELGHRYWYKQMTSEQRAHFESLVRTHKRPKPQLPQTALSPFLIPEDKIKEGWERLDALAAEATKVLQDFKVSRLRWFRDILQKFEPPLGHIGGKFFSSYIDALHFAGSSATVNADVRQKFETAQANAIAFGKLLRNVDELDRKVNAYPDGTDWTKAFKKEQGVWLEEAEQLLKASVRDGRIYIESTVKAYNAKEVDRTNPQRILKEWEDEWDNDSREVIPVSTYGENNISEAFAEVFAHYIVGKDMNRDQIESFKAVLKISSSNSSKTGSLEKDSEIRALSLAIYSELDPQLQSKVDDFLDMVLVGRDQPLEAHTPELYEAYTPVRKLMQRKYGSSIRLYRGEPKDKPPIKRKFLSWTPSRKLAVTFATKRHYEVVEADMHSGDVVAIFASPHNPNYIEYLCRDRKEYHEVGEQLPYLGTVTLSFPYANEEDFVGFDQAKLDKDVQRLTQALHSKGGKILRVHVDRQNEGVRVSVLLPPTIEVTPDESFQVGEYIAEWLRPYSGSTATVSRVVSRFIENL